MIQKYQKKPVTIEAIQWTKETIDEALTWIPSETIGIRILGMEENPYESLKWTTEHYIKTLEGDMKISEGDFIIKGVKGEFYPCKPDIFYATYDKGIDAGTFLADLLTKELEELGDEDFEPREEVLNPGVDPVLRLKEWDDPNTISFRWNDNDEVILRISKDGFYYRGALVEDIHNIYERFNEWLTKIE